MRPLSLFLILLATFALCGAKSKDEPKHSSPSEPISLPLTRVIDGNTFIAGNLNVRLQSFEPAKLQIYPDTTIQRVKFN